jgi:hypothetical protein
MPALTRSAIIDRSISATDPRIVKTIFPIGVVVSICSDRLTNSMGAGTDGKMVGLPRALVSIGKVEMRATDGEHSTRNGEPARLVSAQALLLRH